MMLRKNRRKLFVENLEDRRVLATFVVTDLGDAGDGTLRDAVRLSNETAGVDEIVFDASLNGDTILLTSGQVDIVEPVTINAMDLGDGIVIDASGSDPTPDIDDGMGSRVFQIQHQSEQTGEGVVILQGLTLQGGDVDGDGGLIHSSTSLQVDFSVLQESHATGDGGAVFDSGAASMDGDALSTAEINATRFLNNTSGANGGAVALTAHSYSGLSLANVQFESNEAAANGGGLIITGTATAEANTLDNLVFLQNSALNGGGIAIQSEGLSFDWRDVLVTDNTATEDGGGIHVQNTASQPSNVEWTDLSLTSNDAGRDGGGIHAVGSFAVDDAFVFENTAVRHGGGINMVSGEGDENFAISRSTVANNQAGENGGGIRIDQDRGTTLIRNVSSTENSAAAGDGGGLVLSGQGQTVDVIQSTISGNSASGNGGGVFAQPYSGSMALDPTMTFTNVTIANNGAALELDMTNGSGTDGVGGGIYANSNEANAIRINNSILADNTRGPRNEASEATMDDFSGSDVSHSVNFSIIESNPDAADVSGQNLVTGVDPMLGSLLGNGGGVQTHELLVGSPAIDAGSENLAPSSGNLFDQRGDGFIRLRDGDNDGTATIDMGAIEVPGDNDAPTISTAGAVTTRVDELLQLDASGTVDPDNSPGELTYRWSILSRPDNPDLSATFENVNSATPEFRSDTVGDYELFLEVSDGVETSFEFVTITVVENAAPTTAAVLEDGPYSVGIPFTLDARGSTDPDGDALSFVFTPSENVTVDDSEPGLATFLFTEAATDVEITVTSNDGVLDGATLTFTVDIEAAAAPWHNVTVPTDVNNDGEVTPLDALLVINELTLREHTDAESGEFLDENRPEGVGFLDVLDNGVVAPLDALTVINELSDDEVARSSIGTIVDAGTETPPVVFDVDLADKSEVAESKIRLIDLVFAG